MCIRDSPYTPHPHILTSIDVSCREGLNQSGASTKGTSSRGELDSLHRTTHDDCDITLTSGKGFRAFASRGGGQQVTSRSLGGGMDPQETPVSLRTRFKVKSTSRESGASGEGRDPPRGPWGSGGGSRSPRELIGGGIWWYLGVTCCPPPPEAKPGAP
eukprot:1189244-Prorocentrum_minimum.AAC.2